MKQMELPPGMNSIDFSNLNVPPEVRVLQPLLYKEGDKFCAVLGPDPQEGFCNSAAGCCKIGGCSFLLIFNCAAAGCVNGKYGQPEAEVCIYTRFRSDRPRIFGNLAFRSLASFPIIFLPQPAFSFCSRIVLPISQYVVNNSVFAICITLCLDPFMVSSNCLRTCW
jgi:hypothetical protein